MTQQIFVFLNISDSKAFLFLFFPPLFVGVLNFCLTEGPFIHSPTLWEHLEFHLTPPPCTFWAPLLTQTGALIMWPLSISTAFLLFFCLPPQSLQKQTNIVYQLPEQTKYALLQSAQFMGPSSDFYAKYILITQSVGACVSNKCRCWSSYFSISL